jgi:biotin operon repressor
MSVSIDLVSQKRTELFLKSHTGQEFSGEQMKPVLCIQVNTIEKNIKHLRDAGAPIMDRMTTGTNDLGQKVHYKLYRWEEKKEPIHQVDDPCSCGSYYRRGNVCNVCAK